jgi:transposase
VLTLPTTVRVFVATQPVDCRKSFDGLSIAVANVLAQDPRSGHLYCFFNRRANQVRVLFWDRTGWCVVAKRLARGRFGLARVRGQEQASMEVDAAELMLILEGIELRDARRRRRFRLPTSPELPLE